MPIIAGYTPPFPGLNLKLATALTEQWPFNTMKEDFPGRSLTVHGSGYGSL
jgi:hypothetical protein